jgi:hypothetical protein
MSVLRLCGRIKVVFGNLGSQPESASNIFVEAQTTESDPRKQ